MINQSAVQSVLMKNVLKKQYKVLKPELSSTRMRFELMRAEHNRLAVCRLNRSATASVDINDGQIIKSAHAAIKLFSH